MKFIVQILSIQNFASFYTNFVINLSSYIVGLRKKKKKNLIAVLIFNFTKF